MPRPPLVLSPSLTFPSTCRAYCIFLATQILEFLMNFKSLSASLQFPFPPFLSLSLFMLCQPAAYFCAFACALKSMQCLLCQPKSVPCPASWHACGCGHHFQCILACPPLPSPPYVPLAALPTVQLWAIWRAWHAISQTVKQSVFSVHTACCHSSFFHIRIANCQKLFGQQQHQ